MNAEIDSKKCEEAGTQAECPPVKVWFECPHCEQQLDVDAQLNGNQRECLRCSFQFQSPRASLNAHKNSQKKKVLIGGFILSLAVLSAGLWIAVAHLGSDPESQLRERSQVFWQGQKEDPATLVDYVQFISSGEKEKVRQLLKREKRVLYSSTLLPCTLMSIEVNENRGITHFAGKATGKQRPAIEMEWKYENDQWYLEKMWGSNVRESLLTRVKNAELSRLLQGAMIQGQNPEMTPELARKFQEVMRPQIQDLLGKIEESRKAERNSSGTNAGITEPEREDPEIRTAAHPTPTETVTAFMEALMKGTGGLDEAVLCCTLDAGEGLRVIYDRGGKFPDFMKIEYGQEKIDGSKAMVELSTTRYDNDKGTRVGGSIFFLERDRGRWGIVSFQNKKSGYRLRFASHSRR